MLENFRAIFGLGYLWAFAALLSTADMSLEYDSVVYGMNDLWKFGTVMCIYWLKWTGIWEQNLYIECSHSVIPHLLPHYWWFHLITCGELFRRTQVLPILLTFDGYYHLCVVGEEPPLMISPDEADLQGLTEEEKEKQREIWQKELAKVGSHI